MSREVVTRLYCHNDLISLVMLDRQREPLMYIDSRRREIWEWSDHTPQEWVNPRKSKVGRGVFGDSYVPQVTSL
jgi:hypothetical protein